MSMLKLPPDLIAYIRAMPEMPRATWVPEATVRPLTGLSPAKQLAAATRVLPAFGGRLQTCPARTAS
jgi:hypothetical protein